MLDRRAPVLLTRGACSTTAAAFPPIRLIKKSLFMTRPKMLDYVSTREELMMRADECASLALARLPRWPRLCSVPCAAPCAVPWRYCQNRPLMTLTPMRCVASFARRVFGWIQSGDLKVGIDKTFDLSDAVAGHQYLEAGKSKGKLLYKVN